MIRQPNLREKAIFHERLGKGGHGSVYRVSIGGMTCALKKIDVGSMQPQQKEYALREVRVLTALLRVPADTPCRFRSWRL